MGDGEGLKGGGEKHLMGGRCERMLVDTTLDRYRWYGLDSVPRGDLSRSTLHCGHLRLEQRVGYRFHAATRMKKARA